MGFWRKVGQVIDTVSEMLGRVGFLLVLYSMAFGLYDVIMRYFFNSPSLWIGVTIQYAMVLLACVSGAYALKNDAFVKLDLFYGKASPKLKAIFDIATYSLTLLYLSVLIIKGYDAGMASLAIRQVTPTAVPIPLYHLKLCIPVGALFVLLIATKKLIFDIRILLGLETVEEAVAE